MKLKTIVLVRECDTWWASGARTMLVLRLFHRITHPVYRTVHACQGCKRYDRYTYCTLQHQPCPLHGFLQASLPPLPDQMVIEGLPPLSPHVDSMGALSMTPKVTMCLTLRLLKPPRINCNHSEANSN